MVKISVGDEYSQVQYYDDAWEKEQTLAGYRSPSFAGSGNSYSTAQSLIRGYLNTTETHSLKVVVVDRKKNYSVHHYLLLIVVRHCDREGKDINNFQE